jgi:hypothetical protein
MSTNNLPAIFRFAFFPTYESDIRELAENLADREQWDFTSSIETRYSILKNYINHYYNRLNEEKKVIYTSNNDWSILIQV